MLSAKINKIYIIHLLSYLKIKIFNLFLIKVLLKNKSNLIVQVLLDCDQHEF